MKGNIKRKRRTLQELNLVDDFLFSKVMASEEICRQLLKKILGVPIRRIARIEAQKTVDIRYESKGIRMDVYLTDEENTVYQVEMQSGKEYYLPKRTRYYQGNIDFDFLSRGMPYKNLPKSYIIFICCFDYFNKGRHIYTFENICLEDNCIHLLDETQRIFLNTKGTLQDVDQDMLELLHYLKDSSEEVARSSVLSG